MITVKNISKKYGDFQALKEVSFQVKKGEILCLLGANGAGKSTTINILLNFTRATSGIAEINALRCFRSAHQDQGVFDLYTRKFNVISNL